VSSAGEERIAAAFAASGKRAALMPYMMGCYPDLRTSVAIGEACAAAGADLLELGVPFSDPLADGPVIHAAATAALAAGSTVAGVLEVAAALSPRVAVVLMAYANTLLAPGLEACMARLEASGVSGLIVPDLPLEEAGPFEEAAAAAGIALVPLVAPTTPDERMAAIGAHAHGFMYVVSVTGTTGERGSSQDGVGRLLARARAATSVPVALGFGISTPQQAAAAADAGADGVIIGSRLVRAAADGAPAVGELVAAFAAALG
jgi:tryptophan synthase alpha chain